MCCVFVPQFPRASSVAVSFCQLVCKEPWYPFWDTDLTEKSYQTFYVTDSLHSSLDAEWASEIFRGLFKCRILCFLLASQAAGCLVKWELAGKIVVTSQILFLEKTTFLNPRGVPWGYQDTMLFLSLPLFLLLVTLPRSRLLKNKLVVCLSHTVRLCSGSSLSGTDVIRLRHERTVSRRRKTPGVSLFPFRRIHRHQQKEWRTEVCPQCFVVKGSLLLETSWSWFWQNYTQKKLRLLPIPASYLWIFSSLFTPL